MYLNTNLWATVVKTTVHREINICSLYIPFDKAINKSKPNKLIVQLL